MPLNVASTFFFKGFAGNRVLHSFPTRRSSDLQGARDRPVGRGARRPRVGRCRDRDGQCRPPARRGDRKSTRLNSSHSSISYAVFCLKKKRDSAKSLRRQLSVWFAQSSCLLLPL